MPVHAADERASGTVGVRARYAKRRAQQLEQISLIDHDFEACGVDQFKGKAGEPHHVVHGGRLVAIADGLVREERILGSGRNVACEQLVFGCSHDGLDGIGARNAQDIDFVGIAYKIAERARAKVKVVGKAKVAVVAYCCADDLVG